MSIAPWLAYALAFLGPFVQEDAAVVGAAGATMSPHISDVGLLGAVFAGLMVSDIWKYWAGRFAERARFASKWIADPRVQSAREKVLRRLGVTLLLARFVPGTRVPLYVACGVFKAPFGRFLTYVALSGALYVGATFALFHSLDMIAGEHIRAAAPFMAIAIVLTFLGINWLKSRAQRAA